jgi:hypothetical protein
MIFFGKFRSWRSVTTITCNSKIKADLIAAAIEEIKQIEDWKTEPDTLVVEFEYESNR